MLLLLLFNGNIFAEVHKSIPNLQPIEVEITSYLGQSQVFEQGDHLKFLVSLSRDAYLYVFYQTANNQLIQLIPNQSLQDNFFKADIFIAVPNDDATFEFIVSPPFGDEKVFAIAVDKPIDLESKLLSNGLKSLSFSVEQVKENLISHAKIFYGEASFSLLTRVKASNKKYK